MHPRLRRACLGIFLALMFLTTMPACGVRQLAQGEIQPPKVTFQDLKIYPPTARGWPLGARLLLENPNPQAVNLLGYDYQLWIEGKSVAQGVSQQAVNLPPTGQTMAEVPIMVQLPTVMELLHRFLPHAAKAATADASFTIRSPAASASLPSWEALSPSPSSSRVRLPPGRHGLSPPLPAVNRGGKLHQKLPDGLRNPAAGGQEPKSPASNLEGGQGKSGPYP